MTSFKGRCHCGGVAVEYVSDIAPDQTYLRACQCAFCRMHQSLAVSDPEGSLTFTEARAGGIELYRFGLKTSDFIVCKTCGAYAGALMKHQGKTVGIANIHLFEAKEAFTGGPAPMDYSAEDQEARIARRAEKWMPATLQRASNAGS
ncbi:MAG: hypothetical protein GY948_19710 [Alphaproteobacteria bacterium]|nr:hypothetical protein [Alphaproteobacteria bacterium]